MAVEFIGGRILFSGGKVACNTACCTPCYSTNCAYCILGTWPYSVEMQVTGFTQIPYVPDCACTTDVFTLVMYRQADDASLCLFSGVQTYTGYSTGYTSGCGGYVCASDTSIRGTLGLNYISATQAQLLAKFNYAPLGGFCPGNAAPWGEIQFSTTIVHSGPFDCKTAIAGAIPRTSCNPFAATSTGGCWVSCDCSNTTCNIRVLA